MSLLKKIQKRRLRRTLRVRSRCRVSDRLRVSIFRSHKNMYAQIIDDVRGVTLVSCSTKVVLAGLVEKIDKTAAARLVGLELGKLALKENISQVRIDRGGFLYHGRVKALVEGLRESGLNV